MKWELQEKGIAYDIINGIAFVNLGEMCWSRRSCHDTHYALYNAKYGGEARRNLYAVTPVGQNFAFIVRQYSFKGNLKYNILEVYKWDSDKLYKTYFNFGFMTKHNIIEVLNEVFQFILF